MAPLSLSQLLDVAIGTPEAGAVNFRALRSVLQAILGQLGLRDLPVQVGEERLGQAHPSLEKKGEGTKGVREQPQLPGKGSLQGTASSPQVDSVAADVGQMKKKMEVLESSISKDLLGEIGGVKAAQSRMEEDIRTIQEALGLGNLQDAASRLPGLRDQSALESDVKSLKEKLSLYPTPEEMRKMVRWEVLEDSLVGRKAAGEGGSQGLPVEGTASQFAPTKPPTSDMDAPHGASSALGLKGLETPEPVPRTSTGTSTGTPGTQPGSSSTQITTPGLQAGSPSTQTTTPGLQAGSPGTQTTTPGLQAGTPGTQTTIPGMQAGSPSIQTTIPGMQPGSPSTQTTNPGLQTGSPGTQTTTPGLQAGSPSTQTATPGLQAGSPGTQTTTPGLQAGTPGTQTTIPGMQPGSPSADHLAAEILPLRAQEFEIPLDADVRVRSSSQELAVPWGSSGSTSSQSCYPEMVDALRQIGQLSHLYGTLKEQVVQLEATNLDHAEVEKLRQLFTEGGQESVTSVLADLRDQMSSLQGLASDLQGEKGKIRQLEDAVGKLEVAGADWKADGSDQSSLQTGATLQAVKQELKELREQQEMTKSMLEELVARIPEQVQEQPDKLKGRMKSMGQEQAEVQAEKQAECPVCCTDISAQVGQLLQRYENLQELVDSFTSQHLVRKVVRQPPGRSQDKELLKHVQATLVHLQGDYKKLSSITGNLLDDSHQKQKDIEALFQSLERMEKEKADKEDLRLGIDVKADKSALGSKVSRSQFDTSMERLNEALKEMLSKVTGQEQHWHQFQRQLRKEMDSKLDRMELGPFQQQLEEHCENILEKMKKKGLEMDADDAAGIKKQLLAPFQCLSCDCPLKMVVPGPQRVAIPSMPALPSRPVRSPDASLKQEQMQQHVHREQVADGKYPRVPRPCGGQHTLTHPLQRRQTLPPLALQTPSKVGMLKGNEMELLGQDGSIYRGRQDGQRPVLVGKEATSQHRPASSPSNLCPASGFLPTLGDGSRTPSPGQDRRSPSGAPLPRPPSRRGSGSGRKQ